MTRNRATCDDCGLRYNSFKDYCPHCERTRAEKIRKQAVIDGPEYQSLDDCKTLEELKEWLAERLLTGRYP